MSEDDERAIAALCLPVFFDADFPVEKMNWDTVNEYAPFIFMLKRDEVNAIALKYIDETMPQAWFRDMFNKEFLDAQQEQ